MILQLIVPLRLAWCELRGPVFFRRRLGSDIEQIQNDRMVRNALEDLNKHDKAQNAAVILLQWLAQVAQAAI